MILETSNGRYDPLRGDFSETILKLAPKAVRVVDAFVPSNHAHNLKMDLSGSASPVVFEFAGKTLIAATPEGRLSAPARRQQSGRRRSSDALVAIAAPGQ